MELEAPLDENQLRELATPPIEKLMQCIVRWGDAVANPDSPLAREGVEEAGLIAVGASGDGFAAGPIAGWWPHGFQLRLLTLQTGAYVPMHARAEAEVLIVQEGTLEVSWGSEALLLGAGDTLTIPTGLPMRSGTPLRCRPRRLWYAEPTVRRRRSSAEPLDGM
jgi:mannose-6-phosphate isomerase-like protein (cupin superfamily)